MKAMICSFQTKNLNLNCKTSTASINHIKPDPKRHYYKLSGPLSNTWNNPEYIKKQCYYIYSSYIIHQKPKIEIQDKAECINKRKDGNGS